MLRRYGAFDGTSGAAYSGRSRYGRPLVDRRAPKWPSKEGCFDLSSETTADQVRYLCDDEGWNDEVEVVPLQDRDTAVVVVVGGIDRGVERSRVNDGDHRSTRSPGSLRSPGPSIGTRSARGQ
jgi:hypothetical protein